MPDGLHLTAVDDLVAEAEEDVLRLAGDLRQRMEVPQRRPLSRKGHVEALGGDEPVGALEERAALLHGRLEPLADGVQGHAGLPVPDLAEG